jgi:hypothetical protein
MLVVDGCRQLRAAAPPRQAGRAAGAGGPAVSGKKQVKFFANPPMKKDRLQRIGLRLGLFGWFVELSCSRPAREHDFNKNR